MQDVARESSAERLRPEDVPGLARNISLPASCIVADGGSFLI